MKPEIALLKQYGHFDNPMVPHVAPDEWDRLTLTDPRVQAAIHSYQSFMAPEFEELTIKHHHRPAMFDGLIGPATEDLLSLNRCACPDYLPMTESATGSGSWPPGCYSEEPTIHSVKFHVNTSRRPSIVTSNWDEIRETIIHAYAECGMLLVEVQDIARAHITVKWETLAGSTIGLAELPGSGSCGRVVFCKLDPGYAPNVNQFMQLWAHELGHNMNSGHISGDPIMHPSMTNQNWNKSFKGTAFGRRLDSYFGGEFVGPSDPEPPTPPGPPDIEIPNGAKIKVEFDEDAAEIVIGSKSRKYRRITEYGDI